MTDAVTRQALWKCKAFTVKGSGLRKDSMANKGVLMDRILRRRTPSRVFDRRSSFGLCGCGPVREYPEAQAMHGSDFDVNSCWMLPSRDRTKKQLELNDPKPELAISQAHLCPYL